MRGWNLNRHTNDDSCPIEGFNREEVEKVPASTKKNRAMELLHITKNLYCNLKE